MTFKIQKEKKSNKRYIYYPMVKKRFWGWYYIYELSGRLKITKDRCGLYVFSIQEAKEIIDYYKKGRLSPSIQDILID